MEEVKEPNPKKKAKKGKKGKLPGEFEFNSEYLYVTYIGQNIDKINKEIILSHYLALEKRIVYAIIALEYTKENREHYHAFFQFEQ